MYVMNPYLATLLIAAHRERVVTRIAFANLALGSILFPSAVLAGGALYLAVASVVVELSGHCQTLIAVKRLMTGSGLSENKPPTLSAGSLSEATLMLHCHNPHPRHHRLSAGRIPRLST